MWCRVMDITHPADVGADCCFSLKTHETICVFLIFESYTLLQSEVEAVISGNLFFSFVLYFLVLWFSWFCWFCQFCHSLFCHILCWFCWFCHIDSAFYRMLIFGISFENWVKKLAMTRNRCPIMWFPFSEETRKNHLKSMMLYVISAFFWDNFEKNDNSAGFMCFCILRRNFLTISFFKCVYVMWCKVIEIAYPVELSPDFWFFFRKRCPKLHHSFWINRQKPLNFLDSESSSDSEAHLSLLIQKVSKNLPFHNCLDYVSIA